MCMLSLKVIVFEEHKYSHAEFLKEQAIPQKEKELMETS